MSTVAQNGLMGVGPIILSILFAAVLIGIVLVMAIMVSRLREAVDRESAWGILRHRYASGEISKEQFTKEKEQHVHSGSCYS